MIQSLNGLWELGINREYSMTVQVPGIVYAADEIPEGEVWYRKKVILPHENFENAVLILHGAKYAPSVYVNGSLVSQKEGGMAPTVHLLKHKDVRAGAELDLEICLETLNTMDKEDASYLPPSDHWRSNLTSHLWDDVEIVLYNSIRVDWLIPEYENGAYYIRYKGVMERSAASSACIHMQLYDDEKCIGTYHMVSSEELDLCEDMADEGSEKMVFQGKARLILRESVTLWSPECPKIYRIRCEADGAVWEQEIGFKQLEILDKHFRLNQMPMILRMSSIVWHRAYRDTQFQELAYDSEWFCEEIIKRLKRYGVNTLRFHLGNPPRRFLELCDKHGLLTQVEWIFFHEANARADSMEKQYENWLGTCLKHPSTGIVHPWNEVNDVTRHEVMIKAAEKSQEYFPEYIMSHRDVIHMHAYWWSMFENLGLYYDSFEQFDKPLIADEFGGNYLDYDGECGEYPTVKDSMQRFLGPDAERKESRVWLHTLSNGKVAEYWRRLHVAGFSPFCLLSSPQDGNTHFFGCLKKPVEMPVWEALKPAYYPIAASMDIWDRNFEPGQQIMLPIHLFNDTEKDCEVTVQIACEAIDRRDAKECIKNTFDAVVPAFSQIRIEKEIAIPNETGMFRLTTTLGDAVSSWDIYVHRLQIPEFNGRVGILSEEKELAAFLHECNIDTTNDWADCDVILGMQETYTALKRDKGFIDALKNHMDKGKKAILLSVGPQRLDARHDEEGKYQYDKKGQAILEEVALFDNISLHFSAFPEGESHVHPDDMEKAYWKYIPKQSFWLWNGLRGGLIVPAVNMEVEGVSAEGALELWKQRGANASKIKTTDYRAFECMGIYEFGEGDPDEIKAKLMQRVNFLLADAPALKNSRYTGEITEYNLSAVYGCLEDNDNKCIPLIHAGKELKRIPAVEVLCGTGTLIVAQLIIDGRLTGKRQSSQWHMSNAHRDPAVCQVVLNMLVD